MATALQKATAKLIMEKPTRSIGSAMLEAGYKKGTALNPKELTNSKGWQDLMDTYLADETLAVKHKELLEATGIGHMVFPVDLTDEDIIEFLQEANCKVKRFLHSDTGTHVWYFDIDNTARKNALELAYKLKGRLFTRDPGDESPTIQINITGILQKAYARGQTRRNSTV